MSKKKSPLLNCYSRLPLEITGGKGVMLHGKRGKKYLDFSAGIAVNSLGHQHPALQRAMRKAARGAWHTANLFQLSIQQKYAAKLTKAAGMDVAFFCSSGLEAVETAIKIARQYQYQQDPKRHEIISLEDGFHGRSLTCLAAGGNSVAREGFGPLPEGFVQVPKEDIAALEAAITPKTAAILLEPVQAEGGIYVLDPHYLQQVAALARTHNVLLICDEVQCGFGRTGSLFHYQQSGFVPDIVTSAKGIGGGFPLAATLMRQAVADAITPGMHGSTYGGNLLAMQVGLAVLKQVSAPKQLKHVREMGQVLTEELQQLHSLFPQHIAEIRGTGLLCGVVLTQKNAAEIVAIAAEKGLIITRCGENQVLRITPPLIIEKKHIQKAFRIFVDVLNALGHLYPPPV